MKRIILAYLVGGLAYLGFAETVNLNPGVGKEYTDSVKRTGSVELNVLSGIVTLNPANDYAGTTTVKAGTLNATKLAGEGEASSIGAIGPLIVNGSVLHYSGQNATLFGHVLTNTATQVEATNLPMVVNLDHDVTFTNRIVSGYSPFIKTGPGAMIVKTPAKTYSYIPETKASELTWSAAGLSKRFVLPADGTAPRNGFGQTAILEGKVIVESGRLYINYVSYVIFGGWTADKGEQEKDVEIIVNGGWLYLTAIEYVGHHHGFRDYNTPKGAAKVYLTVNNGGTIFQHGGHAFTMGSYNPAPTIDGTKMVFNSDLRLTINKGGIFTHDTSSAEFRVFQRPGQPVKILVNGGTFHDYDVRVGANAVDKDTTAKLDIDIRNGGVFENIEFHNAVCNLSKLTVSNPPPTTIRVTSGGSFLSQAVTNYHGTLDFHFDSATVGVYTVNTDVAATTRNKVIIPASATLAEIGEGGVTLVSQGYAYSDKSPNIAIFEKPFTRDTSLDDSTPDGGITVVNATYQHVTKLYGEQRYRGPTTVRNGLLKLIGSTSKLPASTKLTLEDGGVVLSGSRQTLQQLKLKSADDGYGISLGVGPQCSIQTYDFAVEGAPTIWLAFVDANGESLTSSQSDRAILTIPTSATSELLKCEFGTSAISTLGLSDLRVVDNGDGTSTLRATMLAQGSPGIPSFADGFGAALRADGTYEIKSTIKAVTDYTAGTYVVAHYKQDEEQSIVDRFHLQDKIFKSISFTEKLITSGQWQGYYEIKLTIADTPENAQIWDGGNDGNFADNRLNWRNAPAVINVYDGSVHAVVDENSNKEFVFRDGTRLRTFLNRRPETSDPFWIRGATSDAKLMIDGSLLSNNTSGTKDNWDLGQIVLQGHITTVGDEDVTKTYGRFDIKSPQLSFAIASVPNASKPTTLIGSTWNKDRDGWSVPLVLAGVTIDRPVYVCDDMLGTTAIYGYPNTKNTINGRMYLGTSWAYLTVAAGAELDIRGGGSNGWTWKKNGEGTLRFLDKPWVTQYMWELARGKQVFGVRGNQFICSSGGGTLGLTVTGESELEFTADGAFENGKTTLQMTGTSREVLEVHRTTNTFQRVRFTNSNKNSYLHGDYPAMIVVNGGYPDPAYYKDPDRQVFDMVVSMPITGGLGFRKTGSSETLIFRGRDFESSGDLEVDAGVIEFEETATWKNGRVFRATGTGKFIFHTTKQIGRGSTFYFGKGGTAEFGEGLLKLSAAYVEDDEGVLQPVEGGVYKPGDGSELGKHIFGNVVVQVGGFGSIIRFW